MIILYTNYCPKCEILDRRLNDAHIEYDMVDNVDYMISLGLTHTPMLGVNGKILNFSDAINWIKEQEK